MAELTLTTDQIAHFDREGFLILRSREHNLIPPTLLKTWTTEIHSLPLAPGKWMPYNELTPSGTHQLLRTENFVDYHPGFASLLHGAPLNDLLKHLTGDDMLLFKDKINYKLPGSNAFAPHLDAPAYNHIRAIEHTTANFAVDAATLANGCIEIVPRSHRMSVDLVSGGAISAAWVAEHEWVPVELEAGDLLIFGSHLAHRSMRNGTGEARGSVYATFSRRGDGVGLRERYYKLRREEFPPDHERIPGRDYGGGVARYAFAAPFTRPDASRVVSR